MHDLEYFQGLKHIDPVLEDKREAVERLRAKVERVTRSFSESVAVQEGLPQKHAVMIEQLAELEAEMATHAQALADQYITASQVIDQIESKSPVDTLNMRRVMRLRFLCDKTVEETAKHLGYSVGHVSNLQSWALKTLGNNC